MGGAEQSNANDRRDPPHTNGRGPRTHPFAPARENTRADSIVPETAPPTARGGVGRRAVTLAQATLGIVSRRFRKDDSPRIDPSYWVLPGVLGGRPSPERIPWHVEELLNAGIGGIVSLDGPIRTKDLLAAGIRHLAAYQPMLLLHTTEDYLRFLKVMPAVLGFIDEERSRSLATLVHCYYGCDRTGSALACYLVAREGCTASQAIGRIQHANPEALWALGYSEVVATFEELYRKDPHQFEVERA